MEIVASICQIRFTFWNFLEFFFSNIFAPWFIKSSDAETKDMGWRANCILWMITYQGHIYDDTKTVKPFRKVN